MTRAVLIGIFSLVFIPASFGQQTKSLAGLKPSNSSPVELIVLGNVQDGGAPHMGCSKSCCAALFEQPNPALKVVSLGLLDAPGGASYLFEATPDISEQMALLSSMAPFQTGPSPDGIFITHAHIGHYAGLMFLGRETLNASRVPLYALPRFAAFIKSNGPWDQLVRLQNVLIKPLSEGEPVVLSPRIQVKAFRVPHRDEYSETAGFEITGPSKKVLFIPDIDKWDQWDVSLLAAIKQSDLAFIDASFYDAAEIGHRDIAEIPHPFVVESMALLKALPGELKSRIYFIHMNHTNPMLNPNSEASRAVEAAGFNIARIGDRFEL